MKIPAPAYIPRIAKLSILAQRLFAQFLLALLLFVLPSVSARTAAAEMTEKEEGFTSIFDGKTLAGWKGDPEVWTLKDGILTGHVPPGKKPTQYLTWTNASEVRDFELRFLFKLKQGTNNAGILYRGEELPNGLIRAYEYSQLTGFRNSRTANIHETGGDAKDDKQTHGRSRLANWGEVVLIESTGNKNIDGKTPGGSDETIAKMMQKHDMGEWQEGAIIAIGNKLIHKINGATVAEVTDGQRQRRRDTGSLTLRVVGNMGDTRISYKSISIKQIRR